MGGDLQILGKLVVLARELGDRLLGPLKHLRGLLGAGAAGKPLLVRHLQRGLQGGQLPAQRTVIRGRLGRQPTGFSGQFVDTGLKGAVLRLQLTGPLRRALRRRRLALESCEPGIHLRKFRRQLRHLGRRRAGRRHRRRQARTFGRKALDLGAQVAARLLRPLRQRHLVLQTLHRRRLRRLRGGRTLGGAGELGRQVRHPVRLGPRGRRHRGKALVLRREILQLAAQRIDRLTGALRFVPGGARLRRGFGEPGFAFGQARRHLLKLGFDLSQAARRSRGRRHLRGELVALTLHLIELGSQGRERLR